MTTPNSDPKPLPVLAIVGAVLLLVGAFTAVLIFGRMKQDAAPSHTSSAAGQRSSASAVDGPGKESQFLRRLEVQNLRLDRSDAAAVEDAHFVCGRFLGGETKDQVVQDILQGSPGMSVDTATDFTDTAIDVYCPDGHRDDPT
jgi:hypothetical protein